MGIECALDYLWLWKHTNMHSDYSHCVHMLMLKIAIIVTCVFRSRAVCDQLLRVWNSYGHACIPMHTFFYWMKSLPLAVWVGVDYKTSSSFCPCGELPWSCLSSSSSTSSSSAIWLRFLSRWVRVRFCGFGGAGELHRMLVDLEAGLVPRILSNRSKKTSLVGCCCPWFFCTSQLRFSL